MHMVHLVLELLVYRASRPRPKLLRGIICAAYTAHGHMLHLLHIISIRGLGPYTYDCGPVHVPIYGWAPINACPAVAFADLAQPKGSWLGLHNPCYYTSKQAGRTML
jgi:hypothetical protein